MTADLAERLDPIRAGMLKAAAEDYRRQCDELDRQMNEAQDKGMRDAWAALMRGDTVERDRICARVKRLPDAVHKAKLEIGLRIGERIGLDRDQLLGVVERYRSTQ